MIKLFTVKPGKTVGFFLVLGIVALQWSFTSAVTGENHSTRNPNDTSTTPVAGKAVAASKKPAPARSNSTVTSSKPALAANLERETISFGSPTGGPDVGSGSGLTSKAKSAVRTSTKSTRTGTKNTSSVKTESTPKKLATAHTKNSGTTSKSSATSGKTTGTTSARIASAKTNATGAKTSGTKSVATSSKATVLTGVWASKLAVFDSLRLKEAGLSKKVFAMALHGMSKLVNKRHIKDNLLAIIDYSQPSNKKRLYVIDLNNQQLLYNTYVAHGMKTGKAVAQYFSNKPASCKSSLGFYITGSTYQGTNGYSLKLQGVEKGINDHAMDRGIVIHGADYVCEGLIESQGFIGRSWGCPAVSLDISQDLIDLLKDGSCLFIYHPSSAYKTKSVLLQ